MARRGIRIKRFLIISVASLMILAGVAVGLVRLADLAAPGYREDVAAWASSRLDKPISIGSMDMLWGWHGPVLALGNVNLLAEQTREPVIGLREFELHFSLLDLIRGERKPRGITLAGTRVTVYRDDQGRFRLEGLARGSRSLDLAETARWLQQLSFIEISDATVVWRPDQTPDSPEAPVAPVQLSGLRAELTNRGPRHRLDAQATLPGHLGGAVQVDAFVFGDLAAPGETRAHGYVMAEQLDIAALLKLAGLDQVSGRNERSRLEAWGDWEKGRFTGARLALGSQAGDAVAAAPQDNAIPQLLPAGMTVDLSLYPDPLGYRLNIDGISSAGGQFADVGGAALFDIHGPRLQAELTRLPASFAAAVLRTVRADQFGGLRASGLLPRLSVSLEPGEKTLDFRGRASFSGLRVQDAQRQLALGTLSGEIVAHGREGELRIDHGSGELVWPPYINGALPIDSLGLQARWAGDAEQALRSFTLAQAHWTGAQSHVELEGELQTGDADTGPTIRASATGRSDDGPALLGYLPQDPALPLHDVRDWLRNAVLKGRVTESSARVEGPIRRFPFHDGGGTLTVDAELEGLDLDYKPGWPVLRNASGRLDMAQESLGFEGRGADMLGIRVQSGKGRIADLRRPVLKLQASAGETAARTLLSVIDQSPLKADFGAVTRAIDVGGNARATLDLSIPLKSELGDVSVDGQATLLGTSLNHALLPRPIDNIRGTLRFDRQGLYAEKLDGRLGRIPVVADIAPGAGDSLVIDVSALPRLPEHRDELSSLVPDLVLDAVSGGSVWHAGLRLTGQGQMSDLTLRSSLKGTVVDLPPPLGKAAASESPVLVTVVADGSRVHVDLAGRADLDLRIQNEAVTAMNVMFGTGGDPVPISDGLRVMGRLDRLDGEAWYDFIADMVARSESQGAAADALALKSINLAVGSSSLWGQRMGSVQLKVLPYQENGYEADFAGEGGRGTIQYLPAPPRSGARALLTGRLGELSITNARNPDRSSPAGEAIDGGLDPGELPITDITVDRLSVNGRAFGSVSLQGRAMANGLRLARFDLTGGEMTATARGSWVREGGLTRAELESEIGGEGVDTLFRLLNYTPTIRADETRIVAGLSISPNPAGLAPGHLQGKLELRLEQGVLMNVEPGAGRVLGLFNFYALPRRLNLDFRDVLSEGLAFDDIRGGFTITDGVARTDGLDIDTPSASIEIEGAIDLGRRTYDQRVQIEPELSSGVALAGTVIGGPAVGAALLVAQRLFKKPLKKMSRISYRLSGSWDDPEIQTLSAE